MKIEAGAPAFRGSIFELLPPLSLPPLPLLLFLSLSLSISLSLFPALAGGIDGVDKIAALEFAPGPSCQKARVILFPKDSMGQIVLLPSSKVRGRVQYLPAAGKVVVPAGWVSKFIPNPRMLKNPDYIDKLPADAFDEVMLTASSLDDSEDGMCDRFLTKIGHLKELVSVNLDRSDSSDVGMCHLNELPNLQRISAFSVCTRGKFLQSLHGMKRLRTLRLAHNSLGDDNLKYMCDLPALEIVDAIGCGLTDAGIKNLIGCPMLGSLAVSTNGHITDQSIKYFMAMKKLRFLAIKRTAITTQGVMQMKGKKFEKIELPASNYTTQQIKAIREAFAPAEVTVPSAQGSYVDPDTKAIFSPIH